MITCNIFSLDMNKYPTLNNLFHSSVFSLMLAQAPTDAKQSTERKKVNMIHCSTFGPSHSRVGNPYNQMEDKNSLFVKDQANPCPS
jgi:hypothetical protein